MKKEVTLSDLLLRVEKLEKAVYGQKTSPRPKAEEADSKGFKGATGGIRFLISKGFFRQKKSFPEITTELGKQGYHYSKQAVQTPLNNLSKNGGPLVGLKEKGKKAYAERK